MAAAHRAIGRMDWRAAEMAGIEWTPPENPWRAGWRKHLAVLFWVVGVALLAVFIGRGMAALVLWIFVGAQVILGLRLPSRPPVVAEKNGSEGGSR